MLDSIKNFFSSSMSPVEESGPEENKKDIRLAACALLLELAYADEEFTEDEREHLESAIRRQYGLEPCLLYTSPSPRDQRGSRMPSSA